VSIWTIYRWDFESTGQREVEDMTLCRRRNISIILTTRELMWGQNFARTLQRSQLVKKISKTAGGTREDHYKYMCMPAVGDRLCGLVVRVPGYRSRGPGFDSRRYQIFWEVVKLERGPLSLVRIIEELLEWKSSGSGQENRINGRVDPLRWPRDTLYPQKVGTNFADMRRSLGRYSWLAD
jgi:hypothetical protein